MWEAEKSLEVVELIATHHVRSLAPGSDGESRTDHDVTQRCQRPDHFGEVERDRLALGAEDRNAAVEQGEIAAREERRCSRVERVPGAYAGDWIGLADVDDLMLERECRRVYAAPAIEQLIVAG